MSDEMTLVLILTFNGKATEEALLLDRKIRLDDLTLAVGRLWSSPLLGDKAEAEMSECPYEIFGDGSLEREWSKSRRHCLPCGVF